VNASPLTKGTKRDVRIDFVAVCMAKVYFQILEEIGQPTPRTTAR
jgi:hypothetical protein